MEEFEKHLHMMIRAVAGCTLGSMPAYVGVTLFLTDGDRISMCVEESEYQQILKKHSNFFDGQS